MTVQSTTGGSGSLTYSNSIPTSTDHGDNDTHLITDDGTETGVVLAQYIFDAETSTWIEIPLGDNTCSSAMTRSQLLAERNAGNLVKDCHYIITDYNRGNVGAASILLHAVDDNTLSMTAIVKTTFDNIAWDSRYDIDSNRITYLSDNRNNEVTHQDSVDNFPWGVTSVSDNRVYDGRLNYTGGTVTDNTILQGAVVTVSAGSFVDNMINPEANVVSSGNTQRNTFANESNSTINSGDFRENQVHSDATVISSTTGDVDNNVFGQLSSSTISGTSNVDNSVVDTDGNLTITGGSLATTRIMQAGNLVMSGGVLSDTTIAEDAQVTIRNGSNYENRFGTSTIFNQVGTGYVRYSTIEGTTTFTSGDVNLSNVSSYVSTVNTTGSTGTISNSLLNRAYMVNLQNIPSLTITDSTISNYGQISANGASRLYVYRGTVTDGSRLLVSANRRLDTSYTNLDSYSYIQVTNGFLRANYCKLSSLGYIQHTSTGTNYAERTNVSSQSNVRFLATTNNCRVYYCNVNSGGSIYHNGSSSGCYFYYCNVSSSSQMYSQNSVNLRAYYNQASGNSQYYSLRVTATHYAYYNSMTGHGYIRHQDSTGGRVYAVHCSGQGLLRLLGATAAGRVYYSSFHAYYYLYANNWTVTRSGLHGYGRRTYTVTNPPANGTFTQNF